MTDQRWRAALLTAMALGGCAGGRAYLAPQFAAPARVVVLPMQNETTDLDGPAVVRRLLNDRLSGKGYETAPLDQIDLTLKEHGFTEGGQLAAARPQALGTWLGGDALVYGTLEEFNYLNVGFYWRRLVAARFKMVDARTGDLLWEEEKKWSTMDIATSPEEAKRNLAEQMAVKAVERWARSPLLPEATRVVEQALQSLPNR